MRRGREPAAGAQLNVRSLGACNRIRERTGRRGIGNEGRAEAARPESSLARRTIDKKGEQKESMQSEEKHRVKGKHETGDVTCWSKGRLVLQHKLKCLLLCPRCGLSTPLPIQRRAF
jgi:hypothetical protein